jgi:hypothetical protein
MLRLWTGSPVSAAWNTSVFLAAALGLLFVLAAGTTYLTAGKGVMRSVLAYLAGSVATFAMIIALEFYLEEIEKVPPVIAGQVWKGMWAVLVGPAIGLWLNRPHKTKWLSRPHKTKWSLSRAALYGLLLQVAALIVANLADGGREFAEYAHARPGQIIGHFVGQMLVSPVIFVGIAFIRNCFITHSEADPSERGTVGKPEPKDAKADYLPVVRFDDSDT